MIKLADAIYEPSLNAYKSKNILKLKPSFEEEYEVALPALFVAVTAHLYSQPADEKPAGKV